MFPQLDYQIQECFQQSIPLLKESLCSFLKGTSPPTPSTPPTPQLQQSQKLLELKTPPPKDSYGLRLCYGKFHDVISPTFMDSNGLHNMYVTYLLDLQ